MHADASLCFSAPEAYTQTGKRLHCCNPSTAPNTLCTEDNLLSLVLATLLDPHLLV
jgi:hypothetical protein